MYVTNKPRSFTLRYIFSMMHIYHLFYLTHYCSETEYSIQFPLTRYFCQPINIRCGAYQEYELTCADNSIFKQCVVPVVSFCPIFIIWEVLLANAHRYLTS